MAHFTAIGRCHAMLAFALGAWLLSGAAWSQHGLPGETAGHTCDSKQPGQACANVSAPERADSPAPMDHSHLPIAAPAGAPAPALSLQLSPDTMSGYNLRLVMNNFSMMPPPTGLTDMAGMMRASTDEYGVIAGHAHLYINGKKTQRLYGRDVHLPASLFRPGVNQITVSINNHGHMYWTFGGRQVLATLFIDPASAQIVAHRFESFPAYDAVVSAGIASLRSEKTASAR